VKLIESDADLASIVDYLRANSPLGGLGNIDAHKVFACLTRLGYRIAKPASHPSGLKSCEEAITTVTSLGAGMGRPATRR
jgi:hypothetical protein